MELEDYLTFGKHSVADLPSEKMRKISEVISQLSAQKIYSTIGVYANGDQKSNGVAAKDLLDHIAYNLQMRPGRAFFLEGRCLNQGYLSDEKIQELEKEFSLNPHRPQEVSLSYR